MKTVAIHYFTGTGNTAHSVKQITEQLNKAGLDSADETLRFKVTVQQVKKDVKPLIDTFDYHIFAFPVLSWAPPVIMKRYMRQMPVSKDTKTAVLAVNGSIFHDGKLVKGYTGQALEQAESILRHKRYDVFLTANASFPDNWTQATNPCSKEDSVAIFPLGDAEVRQFTDDFIRERRSLYRCGWFNRLWSYIVAFLFGLIGRRALGKLYIADENCTGCGLCVKQCPVRTIRMDNHKPKGRPYWGTKCEDCNRCINICPERSIQVSVPLLIILFGINIGLTIYAAKAIFLYTPLWLHIGRMPLFGLELLLKVIATFVLLWVTFVPVAAFFQMLLRIPGARRFFSRSYTQKFRRYKAETNKIND